MANSDGTIAPASALDISRANASHSATVQSLRPEPVAGTVLEINAKATRSKSQNVAEMRATQTRIQEALTRLKAHAKTPRNLSFRLDQVADRWMVTVRDKFSGELIREVPGAAVLKVSHNIESLKGILFDQVL